MAKAPAIALRLYGVIALDGTGDEPATAGAALVEWRDIAALVTETPYARPAVGTGDVDAYRSVVDGVFAQRAILPAPAGVVFRSREALARWLELHYATLTEALTHVEGRVGARVHVARKAERLASLTPSGLEGRGTEEMAIDIDAVAAESFRVLRRHATTSVILRQAGDGTAAVSGFLVEREKWQAFEGAVTEEGKRDPELTFRLTGPWPPYDFVRMQFGR